MSELLKTPLYETHVALNAKMVGFAGYDMPVQYDGVLGEHLWTRENAGLFDVSHMGQLYLHSDSFEEVAKALEHLCPADILSLLPGQQRYSQFTNAHGGVIDDLMIIRPSEKALSDSLFLVVNAGCKDKDIQHLLKHLPHNVRIETLPTQGLIALQGPKAVSVLSSLVKGVEKLVFMTAGSFMLGDVSIHVSRSGYTGEDGFEISVDAENTPRLWNALLKNEAVKPIGLGARDSLRLEAGLCLYGHELDDEISPIEAGLLWSIQKRRRIEGGFKGSTRILKEIKEGATRKIVAIMPEGKAPAREGTEIQSQGKVIGVVKSGGYAPSLSHPIAIGLIDKAFSAVDTPLELIVRGKALPAKVAKLPFVKHNYFRG